MIPVVYNKVWATKKLALNRKHIRKFDAIMCRLAIAFACKEYTDFISTVVDIFMFQMFNLNTNTASEHYFRSIYVKTKTYIQGSAFNQLRTMLYILHKR